MTTGFQQQAPLVNFCFPRHVATPQQVGRKLETKAPAEQRPSEPRTFK
jgi:hypothetical protein